MHRIQNLISNISETAGGLKAGMATSAATTGSGLATVLNLIPADIGKLATLIGLVLSSVLIYAHLQKVQRDREAHELDMEIKELEREIKRKSLSQTYDEVVK